MLSGGGVEKRLSSGVGYISVFSNTILEDNTTIFLRLFFPHNLIAKSKVAAVILSFSARRS